MENKSRSGSITMNDLAGVIPEAKLIGFKYGFIAVLSLLFLVGLVANLLILYFVLVHKPKRSITSVFIANLSVADLLVVLVCIPITAVSEFWFQEWKFGALACYVTSFIQGVSLSVSILTLTAISVDRYLIICDPIKFRTLQSPSRTIIVLILIWVVSCFIMSPLLFVFKYIEEVVEVDHATITEYSVAVSKCFENWHSIKVKIVYEFFLGLVLLILPIGLMTFSFVKISKTLWGGSAYNSVKKCMAHQPSKCLTQLVIKIRKNSISSILNEADEGVISKLVINIERPKTTLQTDRLVMNNFIYQLELNRNRSREDSYNSKSSVRKHAALVKLIEGRQNIVKLVIVLIVLFLICWLPYHCVSLVIDFLIFVDNQRKTNSLISSRAASLLSQYIYPSTLILALSYSAANPICYMAFTPGVFSMLKTAFRRSRSNHSTALPVSL